MNRDYDVIVVGGGLAGLTCMAYLCRYGYRALLCEKGNKTGGLVNTFQYDGFTFDAGIRAFENSGIIFPMLKNLEIDIEFVKNPVSIGIVNQRVQLNPQQSLESYQAMLIALFPGSEEDIKKIMTEINKVVRYIDVLYGIDNPLFSDNLRDPAYLVRTLLPWLFRYNRNISKINRLNEPVNKYLLRFTDNQSLIDMITQHFFKDTPAFFALSYFALYLSYYYPKGGTGTLVQKINEFILASNGEIRTQTAVTRIDTYKKELFTANGERYQYKKLIWAADQKSLYASVTAPQTSQFMKQNLLVEKSKGGDSILTLFLGVNLDKDYFVHTCGAHTFYTPVTTGLSSLSNWEKSCSLGKDELLNWVGKYLDSTTYEISCPALRDEHLAPEGKTGVIVSTLMDYRLVQHITENGYYDTFKQFCIDTILQALEKTIFPDISKHLSFALCSTPITIEKETGNSQGAITGWSFQNDIIPAVTGFKNIMKSLSTPIEDVYQCGQWTFSPSGLPVSIFTGKLAADEVRKTLKR